MKTFYKLCSMLLCSAFLLGGCTKETQTDGGDPRPGDDSIAEVREVMMTLKSHSRHDDQSRDIYRHSRRKRHLHTRRIRLRSGVRER